MEFQEILSRYKRIVDGNLAVFLEGKIKNANDSFLKTSYSFLKEYALRGGKRVRPIATIMAYKAVGNSNEEKIYLPALSTELFHCSSLIHDDIMDEDSLRRNKPSMHKLMEKYFLRKSDEASYNGDIFSKESRRFSVSMAILQGNILYSLAESCLIESDFSKKMIVQAVEVANNSYRTVNHGQMFDILLAGKSNLSEKEYLHMAANKTAKLIEGAIEIGALFGNASLRQKTALKNYAINAALAFQIQDDIIDVTEGMKKRRLGSDIRKGKMALVTIKALSKANKIQKNFLLGVIRNKNPSESDIKKYINIASQTKAIEHSKKTALEKIKMAKSCITEAGLKKESLKFFIDFADFMVDRRI
ncbi:polyprenyl synthetase family protein [Candidatus Woesearchaeota archaeon]|nr:polyprenyl synthetase family protein [Candidatus Woesearchaeota archaeon]